MIVNQSELYGEDAPDWAILIVGANRCVADGLQATMQAGGPREMRPPYGFVIRALASGGLRLTELAERLGVTKQAALKIVDEMEAHGLVERTPAPGTGARRCCASPRGPKRCASGRSKPASRWRPSFARTSATRTSRRRAAR